MHLAYLPVGVLIVVMMACGSSAPTATSPAPTAPRSPVVTPVDVRAEINVVNPAYTGVFANPHEEVLYIYARDKDVNEELVRSVLQQYLGDRPEWRWPVVILNALDSSQLAGWHELVQRALEGVRGVGLVYVHELAAEVVVNVSTDDVADVEARIRELQLPPHAVLIEPYENEPIVDYDVS